MGDPNPLLPIGLAPVSRLSLERSLTVGREAMSGQVVLDHPNVSRRRHAAFEVANKCVVLRDLVGAT
jgi:hypothetical protein